MAVAPNDTTESGTPLELRDITKSFGGTRALDGVSFSARAGETIALVGENGAGKSTLLKIMAGIIQPDSGALVVDGKEARFGSPAAARDAGVAIINQELSVLPDLSIAENVFLGSYPMRGFLVDWAELNRRCAEVIEQVGLREKPTTRVGRLSLAQQQLVEISRAVAQQARIIAMDEPTASLSDSDVRKLIETIRRLEKDGVAIVYVSHRLDEVFEVAPTITVMRDGAVVDTVHAKDSSQEQVVEMMVGRSIEEQYPYEEHTPGEAVLEVSDLVTDVVHGASISVRAGELVGLFGLVGAGRTELAKAVFGADRVRAGTIRLKGEEIRPRDPAAAVQLGIGYVPEDRKGTGLLLHFSLVANHTLPSLDRFTRGGRIARGRERDAYQRWHKTLGIRSDDPDQEAESLSGGNQQKVVLSKWLEREPALLMLDEPTRGVDVGARVEIYEIVNRLVREGAAVLMISSDLPELLGLCDRLVVMHEGRVTGEFPRAEFAREKVMEAAIS